MAPSGQSKNDALSKRRRRRLPGFGLPIGRMQSDKKRDSCFMHVLWYSKRFISEGLKLREIRMMEFVNQITDKPDWERKVFDESIVAKWKEEAKSVELPGHEGDVFLSDKMFDNCIKELRDKAKHLKKTGTINVLDAELAVVKSDTIVPLCLAENLKANIKALEDVPGRDKDWHPKSNGKVLDLVHPSLFPVVHGILPTEWSTRVLSHGKVPFPNCASSIGEGETRLDLLEGGFVKESEHHLPQDSDWGKHQWLPTDIVWCGSEARIVSYVNNLHPFDHSYLYNMLERFVTLAVPLWNECLFRGPDKLKPRITRSPSGNDDFIIPEGIEYKIPDDFFEDEDSDSEEYKYTDEYDEWYDQHRIILWPEPDDYSPRNRDPGMKPNLMTDFPSGLQVVFKLANIHLTPEGPEYGGGSWHVEGLLNDRIVATALYYYDEENITDSRLSFRQVIDADELRRHIPQDEYASLEMWLGIRSDDAPFQEIGSVLTRPGRLLAFPNVFQHKVQPFRLRDPTKPGHRKILAMFLVDPNIRVLSTGVVPPQQRDWWAREVRLIRPFSEIPQEVFDLIIESVEDFPMSRERAFVVRKDLMEERSSANNDFEEVVSEVYHRSL